MTVSELEKKLELAKKQELKEKWEVYLNKVKRFIDSLKGKTIITWYQNGSFVLCKVIGYKEQYYIEREGFSGQWSPCRWLEIETTSYIDCRVADSKGNWYGDRGMNHPDILNFKARVEGSNRCPLYITKIPNKKNM